MNRQVGANRTRSDLVNFQCEILACCPRRYLDGRGFTRVGAGCNLRPLLCVVKIVVPFL